MPTGRRGLVQDLRASYSGIDLRLDKLSLWHHDPLTRWAAANSHTESPLSSIPSCSDRAAARHHTAWGEGSTERLASPVPSHNLKTLPERPSASMGTSSPSRNSHVHFNETQCNHPPPKKRKTPTSSAMIPSLVHIIDYPPLHLLNVSCLTKMAVHPKVHGIHYFTEFMKVFF